MRRAALLASCIPLSAQVCAQAAAAELRPKAAAQKSSGTSFEADIRFGGGWTDNLFATRNHEVSDYFLVAQPNVRFTAFDGDDFLTIRANGDVARYADHESENYNDWLVGADGRFRASKDALLLGGISHQWGHESRESPEAQNGAEPTRYRLLHGYAGVILGSGKIVFRPAFLFDRYDFGDVPAVLPSIINNDDRDRSQVEVGGRIVGAVSKRTQLFVQGAWNTRRYRQKTDDFGFQRDSNGASVAVGIRQVFSPALNGEVFAGYMKQDYRDPRLRDVATPDLGAILDWSGPGGLGANLRLDRSIEETTLPGASSYVVTTGSLTLKASPQPQIEAGLTLGGSQYEYRGDPRSEFVASAEVWARDWFAPNLYAQLDYGLSKRTSNVAGFDFNENRLLVRLGASLSPHYAAGTPRLDFGSSAPGGGYLGLFATHGALVTGLDGPRGEGSNTADFGDTGAGFGGMAGYGSTIGNAYFGAEIEGSLQGPGWQHSAERVFSVQTRAGVGVALRGGWLTPAHDLIYGRIGLSKMRLRTRYQLADFSYDRAQWLSGPNFGLGAEANAGSRAFVRAEYVLTAYKNVDIPSGKGEDNMSSNEGQFRFGAGVRFGAAAKATATPATKFGGPYVGAQIGYGALVSRNLGVREKSQAVDISRGGEGPSLGIFGGYGGVWKRLYGAVEVEADLSRLDWSIDRDPNGRTYSARDKHSIGVALRGGWLISKSALVYGRVGVARARFVIPYQTANQFVLSDKGKTGLRVGGGIEAGLGARDRFRIDYTLTKYGSYDVMYGRNSDRFEHDENVVRVGIVHRF